MKLARNAVVALALAASVLGCDDDDDPTDSDPIVLADLAGDYTISSFTYIPDDGGNNVNLTTLGMGVTELTVASNGSFDGTLVFPHPTTGQPTAFPIGGTIAISNADDDDADLTINFNAATQALGILDASETGSLDLDRGDGTLTMRLTEVTVPQGLPGGGANADLVMVASLN